MAIWSRRFFVLTGASVFNAFCLCRYALTVTRVFSGAPMPMVCWCSRIFCTNGYDTFIFYLLNLKPIHEVSSIKPSDKCHCLFSLINLYPIFIAVRCENALGLIYFKLCNNTN